MHTSDGFPVLSDFVVEFNSWQPPSTVFTPQHPTHWVQWQSVFSLSLGGEYDGVRIESSLEWNHWKFWKYSHSCTAEQVISHLWQWSWTFCRKGQLHLSPAARCTTCFPQSAPWFKRRTVASPASFACFVHCAFCYPYGAEFGFLSGGCELPHSNIKEPQEVHLFFLSEQCIWIHSPPSWPVLDSSVLHKMRGGSTGSSPSPGYLESLRWLVDLTHLTRLYRQPIFD